MFYCKIHDFIAYNLPPPTNNYIKFFNLNLFYCKLNNFIPSPTCSHATTGNPTGISIPIIKRRPCHFLTQTPLQLSLFLHFPLYYIFTTSSPYLPYTAFSLHLPHIFPILLFFYLSHYVLISTPVRNVNIRQFLYLLLVSGTAFIVYSHSV